MTPSLHIKGLGEIKPLLEGQGGRDGKDRVHIHVALCSGEVEFSQAENGRKGVLDKGGTCQELQMAKVENVGGLLSIKVLE